MLHPVCSGAKLPLTSTQLKELQVFLLLCAEILWPPDLHVDVFYTDIFMTLRKRLEIIIRKMTVRWDANKLG